MSSLQEVRLYPTLYDKSDKGYTERYVVIKAWNKVAEKIDFVEDGRPTFLLYRVFQKQS